MSIISSKSVFKGRVIAVSVDTVRLPNDHVVDLEIIHHPGGAAVAAVDDQARVCLIRQFRHAADGWIWELPAGKLEPGEPPDLTVQRELREEAGLAASTWRSLGKALPSPGVLREVIHLYMATGLTTVPTAHEDAELIEIHWLPLQQACSMAESGEITDGKTAIGLLRARAALAKPAAT